jgi:2-dehydro-3-deoxy-D-gluconate 5-dehydrogenase
MTILDAFRLDGKVALVTGARRGLGQALAIGLAEAGADIVGIDRTPDAVETCRAVEAHGRRFISEICDLEKASVAQLSELVERIVQEFGRIDILVNNAGIIHRTPALDFCEADWDAVIQINLKSVFFLSQAAARVMVKQHTGKIINIASMLSYQGGILVPPYTAAKSGIVGLTRALSNEWAPLGINVNAIAPGYMATDNTLPLREDKSRNAAILARIPVGRWGHPDDLKGAVVFLAAQPFRWMEAGWLGDTTPQHPEALMSAVPIRNPRQSNHERRIRLERDVADPANPPSGCYFHPRCRYAQDRCIHEESALRSVIPPKSLICAAQSFNKRKRYEV